MSLRCHQDPKAKHVDSSVSLRHWEALELAHALVQSLGHSKRIRVLLIKGPALHRHGLRNSRESSDVDVLVHPGDHQVLVTELADMGWVERPASFFERIPTAAGPLASHSISMTHHGWPCDVDVHRSFPGFMEDPAVVFEELWRRRVGIQFANQICFVPDVVSSAAVALLHCLRGEFNQPRHSSELEDLLLRMEGRVETEELVRLATVTGSLETLAPVWQHFQVPVTSSAGATRRDEVAAWQRGIERGWHMSHFWSEAWHSGSMTQKVKLIVATFWVGGDLRVSRRSAIDFASMRLRYFRAAKAIPSALRTRARASLMSDRKSRPPDQ